MMDWLLIYFIANCLFLAYVRLRDVGKLQKTGEVVGVIFVAYIGFLALPLQIIYWLKQKIFPKKTKKTQYLNINELDKP